MKKAIVLLVCLFVLLSFSSCKTDGKTISSSGGGSPSSEAVTAATTVVTTEPTDTNPLAEINASQVTVVHAQKAGHFEGLSDGGCVFFTGDNLDGHYPYGQEPAELEATRYDANGNILWEKTYPEFNDVVGGAGLAPDGAVVFSCYAVNSDYAGEGTGSTGWLVKVSSDGSILWKQAITKNYQSAFAFYFAANGDIYTQGLFNGFYNDAGKPLVFSDTSAASSDSTTTFCRYDKSGKELSHQTPDADKTGSTGGEYNDNFAKAAYIEGIGLVAVYPGSVVCYRADLSQRWNYKTDMTYPVDRNRDILVFGDPQFGKDNITVTFNGGKNADDNTTAILSYSGRLISKSMFKDDADCNIGTLPDGRDIYLENDENDKTTTVNFLIDGQKTQFDVFNNLGYPTARFYPIYDDRFTVAYQFDDKKIFTAIVNYDSSGGLRSRIVYDGYVGTFVSSSSVEFVGLPPASY